MKRQYIVHSETGIEPTTLAFQVLEDALSQKDSRVLLVVPRLEFAAARTRALEVAKKAGVAGYQREGQAFAEWGDSPSVLVAVPSANLCGQGFTHIIVAMGPFAPGEVAAKPEFTRTESGLIRGGFPKENMSEEDVLRLPDWFSCACMTRRMPGSLVLLAGPTMHSGLRALCCAIGGQGYMIDWWVRDFNDIGPVKSPLLPIETVYDVQGQWTGVNALRFPDPINTAACVEFVSELQAALAKQPTGWKTMLLPCAAQPPSLPAEDPAAKLTPEADAAWAPVRLPPIAE